MHTSLFSSKKAGTMVPTDSGQQPRSTSSEVGPGRSNAHSFGGQAQACLSGFLAVLMVVMGGAAAMAQTVTYNYTGGVQTYTVPVGVTSISVDVNGAAGFGLQGYGGRVQCNIPVTPGEVLNVYVGGQGSETAGGFNGGGTPGANVGYAGGGGASDIRQAGTALGNRVVVAGGGGGSGSNCGTWTAEGGHGGGLTGQSGCAWFCSDCQYTGAGGSQVAGGTAGPTGHGSCGGNQNGTLGQGGSNTLNGYGTGGGGGYYGGGSGCFEGAGGGSSYTTPSATSVIHTQGARQGNGVITITPNIVSSPCATPSSVTASPSSLCLGASSNLSAISAGNIINWYTASTGGVLLGTSASGANFTVTPSSTTTYWAEAAGSGGSPGSQTFNFTGGVQTFVVPVGVTTISVDARGAQGGSGGLGGRITTDISVVPGQTLNIYVGGQGGVGSGAAGGFNGGGTAGGSFGNEGGGGGASDIRIGGTGLGNRVVVAGGGGGVGGWAGGAGGAGGGTTGAAGASGQAGGGGGGTQVSGGAGGFPNGGGTGGTGSLGQGGAGGFTSYGGGGGGGGYYGGGGGGADTDACCADGGGGGGGSSFSSGGAIVHTQGYQSGNGQILLSWTSVTCTASPRIAVTVNVGTPPSAPNPVTATNATICVGSTSQLNATAVGSTINWYTVPTGGASIGSSASGANFAVTPGSTTTYYAEAVSTGGGSGSQTFNYTGGVQSFTVPSGVTSITFDVQGAQGGTGFGAPGAIPGLGGRAQTTLTVTPGEVLQIYVGGQGGPGGTTIGGTAGFNGGGVGGGWSGGRSGGGGGGASDVRRTPYGLADRVIVGAGGGGTGVNHSTGDAGGNGGGLTGANGLTGTYLGGGATQVVGGTPNGSFGVGGGAPAGQTGGGGGGGYYGGGGSAWEGGGGGSSFVTVSGSSGVAHTAGFTSGNGIVQLSWTGSSVSCPSATRTAVTVTVNPVPAAPTPVTASPTSYCAPGSSNLNATSTGNTINWYTVPTGGASIGSSLSAANFNVAPGSTTTYYAEAATAGGGGPGSQTFNYTGGSQTFTVPSGVTSLTVDAYGAQGGNAVGNAVGWQTGPVNVSGGLGGRVQSTLAVTPGQTITINVGGQGTLTAGGFNGGGAPAACSGGTEVIWAGGGGASDLRIGGTALTNRVLVAGGGGGSSGSANTYQGVGGVGGGLTGGNGTFTGGGCMFGSGGSQVAGGTGGNNSCWCGTGATSPGGALGLGGNSTCAPSGLSTCSCSGTGCVSGAGGGGGYYGGGSSLASSGAGGGSSFTGAGTSGVTHTQGVRTGNGQIILSWTSTGVACTSPTRTPVTVTVNTVTPSPTPVTATPSSICAGATSQLNATSAGNTISWYTALTGGALVGTSASGANFAVTPGGTTTYYAEAGSGGGPGGSQTFNYTGSLQTFTVPPGVTSITIDGRGAQGGSVTTACAATGGLGARMQGTFTVTPGEVLSVMVGQQGLTNGEDGGGGGGTFVVRTGNVCLLAAGGGGGATNNIQACGANRNGVNASITTSGTASADGLVAGGTPGNGGGANSGSGGGGGGFTTNGTPGSGTPASNGKSYINGGAGGTGNASDNGGYGGGGAGWFYGGNGGGGGGYAGGGTNGGQPYSGGGGGGSFNSGTSQTNTAGFQTGNGQAIIAWSGAGCAPSVRVPVTVTVTPPPVTANAGPDQTVCGSSATLAGNSPGAGTGAWTIISGAGGSVTTPSSPTSAFSGTPGTTYTLRWTVSNPPCATSTDDVVITLVPSPTAANAGPDQTVCASSVTLAANTPSTGTGSWSIVSGAGGTVTTPSNPTSSFTGTAGTTYTLRWTTSNPPCANSTDDVLITLTGIPTTANAGPDQNICGTSTTLAGNTPTTGTGSWSIISGAGGAVTTPSSASSAFTGVAGTTYTLRWTISNPPCANSTDDVVITLTANPSASNAGPDQTVCATSVTLAATPPAVGAGSWAIITGAGGTAANPTSPVSAFNGAAGQIYTIRWTISNSPCPASADDVIVTMSGNPTTANAGPDQTVCATSVTLAGNTPTTGTGSWSIISGAGGTVTTPSSATSAFSGAAGTTYTLRWTTSNPPCANSTDDVVITLTGNPTTANAGPDQTVCATSVTLAGNTPTTGTGTWTIVSGAGGSITTASSPTSGFSGTAGTTYTLRWTISNPPCANSTDDVVITLTGNPTTSNAGPDQTVCATSVTLAGNTPTTGTGTWTIVSGAGGTITTPSSATSAFSGTANTVYTLRWTIANPPCANSTDDVVITLKGNPTPANAGPDQTVCATSVTLAANTPTVGTGSWSIVSGAGGTVTTPSSATSTFTGAANTVYTLRWTTSNPPCANSTDDVVITLTGAPTTSNAGPDQTVCATSVTLAGNTPTTGTGTWTIVSGAGGTITTPSSATSAFSGTANTVYTLRWTIANPPCANSTDDVVISLQGNPTVSNAGPDQTVCATSVTLAGNIPTSGTGTWTIVSGAGGTITTASSPTSGFSGTAGTTYTLRWTISNPPCANSTDDVVITLTANPTASNAGPDQTVCATSVTLAGNTPTVGTGSWSIVSGAGGSITTASSPTSAFSGTAGTTYTLRWTISNPPCANSTDDVVITLTANPTVSNAGPDQTVCATSVTLAGNTPTVGTGTWTIVSGAGGTITTASSPTSTFSGTAGTTYTLRWTIANPPCASSTDDVVITLTGNPTVSNAGPDQTVCATSVTLAGNTPTVGTGSWSIVSGAGGTVTTPTSATSTFSGTAGTTYTLRWTIVNAPCANSTDDVVITLTANPTVSNAGPDQTVCATSVTLAGNTPTVGIGTWTIVSGAGGTITTASSPTSGFSGTAGTTYTLRWTIANPPCASSTDDVVITLTGNPTTSNAGPDQTVCATSVTLAGNAPTVGTGSWSIVSGAGGTVTTPTSATSTFSGTAGTTYTLRWTIVNAPCANSTDDVVITLTANPTVSNAGPDQTVCATSVTLAGNTPTVGTGTWTIVSGAGGTIATASSPTSGFSGAAGTTYTLRWTISNPPCANSTDDVVITLTGNPTVASAGPDQTVCATSVTLAGNTPTVGTGSWSIVSGAGGTVTTPSSATSTFSGAAGTTYTLRWTISNAPCANTSDDVVITLTGNPTVSNAGPDQTVCGGSATLAANTPTTGVGSWTIVSGAGGTVTTPSSATSAFSGTPGVSYTLRWTIVNAPCANSTDDVVINLTASPTVANAGADQNICGTSTTMFGNTPTVGTGSWSVVSGLGGSIATPSSPTTGFTGIAGTTYILRWTISNAPCAASTDDVEIIFTPNPTNANAGPDQAVCATSATLFANTPSIGVGSWSIVSGAGGVVTTPSSPNSSFTGVSGTVYTLRWTVTNAPCPSSTDDVVITLTAPPSTANAGPDQNICATSTTLQGNTPAIGTGSWSVVSGAGGTIATASSPSSTFTGIAGTSYTLRWTIANAPCASTIDDVVITLTAPPSTANAGPDQTLCGSSTILSATTPSTGVGTWSIVSGAGGSIANASNPASGFSGIAGTVYTLRWTVVNAPCANSTDDVVITFTANPSNANAGPDQIVCGPNATLAGNVPAIGTGTWTIISGAGGTVVTPTSATSAFTGIPGITYTLRWTISNPPCGPKTDDVLITLKADPTPSNAGPDQNLCASSTTLAANAPTVGVGSWSIVSGAGGSITTPGSATTAFTGVPGTSYTLRWTIANAPCPASVDDVIITFTANPTTANAGPDQSICTTTATLAGNTPSVGTGTWTIVSGAGGSIAAPSNPVSAFTGTPGTVYTLRWTISNPPCASSTDDVVISLVGNPTAANAGPDQTICGTSATLAGNTPTVGVGSWSIVSGVGGTIVTPSSPTSAFTAVAGNVYTLRWTITNAPCASSTDDVVITTDIISPAIVCPANIVAGNTTGQCAGTATFTAPVGTDNCPSPTTVQIAGGASGSTFALGVTTNTFQVTDGAGHTSTCSFTVTINDTQAPSITCPSTITVPTALGTCAATVVYTAPVGSDNCPGQSTTQVSGLASGSSFPAGTTTNVFSVTDAAGNVTTCSFGVVVQDLQAPVALCQNVTVLLNGTGTGSTTAAAVNNGSSDACGIGSLSLSQTTFVCSEVGANTEVLTVTDLSGNVSTCTTTITVRDLVAPVATCQNVTVQLNNTGVGSTTGSAVNNGSSDACGIASTSLSTSSFGCANVGPNTVTLTVTDVNGNSSTCTASVTVQDNIAPVALCQGVTVQLSNTGTGSTTATAVNNGSSDACGIASTSLSTTSFGCANVGPNTVTLTVTDVNGNTGTCSSTVTVQDNIAPIALCQAVTVQLNGSGSGTATASSVNNGSSDACGIANTSLSTSTFGCANVGPNTVVLTVTDVNGNTSTCSTTITVQDLVAPVATCQNLTLQLNGAGTVTTTATAVDNGSSDACGIGSMSLNPTTFGCANIGGNTATLTVTDVNGNTSTCTATITIQDNVAPTAVCQNVTVQLNNIGEGTTTAAAVDNGSSDACSPSGLTLSLSQTTFFCSEVGTNNEVLTVTDVFGNSSTCGTVIMVMDTVRPTALCQNLTVQLDNSGNGFTTATAINNGSTDACGIASYGLSVSNFTCTNVGANVVTLTVTDVNGNTKSCNANVAVQDNIAPDAICQSVVVQLDNTGNGSTTGLVVGGASNDACGIVSYTLSQTSFVCTEVGTNAETLTVTDPSGNTSTCAVNITVEDNVVPVAVCQAVTVQLNAGGIGNTTAAAVNNGSSDACGIQSLVLNQTTFGCQNVGPNTVILTVTDNHGNVAICSQTIAVQDLIAPVATCQGVTVTLDNTGNGSTTASAVDNGSTDACGVGTMNVVPSTFTCANLGTNTVVLSVNDVNGNTGTCNATVTVVDNIAPVATCQNVTVQLNTGGVATATAAAVNNGSTDACGVGTLSLSPSTFSCANLGSNSAILTVADASGNTSTCASIVTVQDLILPAITCPANQTLLADSSTCGANATWSVPTATDNCGVQSTSATHLPGALFTVGTTTVMYTATDNSGNTGTCTFTVAVSTHQLQISIVSPLVGCGTNVACAGASDASITSQVSGGCLPYTYLWSNGATTANVSGLPAGSYVVTVTDSRNSTATANIILTQPTALAATITGTALVCQGNSGGQLTANATGGQACSTYTYLWNTGATTSSIVSLPGGTYTVTVTDMMGCTVVSTFVIQTGAIPTFSLGPDVAICPGVPVLLQAPTTFAAYQWSNGSQSPSVLTTTPGTYICSVTNSDGCQAADTVVVTQNVVNNNIITVNGSTSLCPGQSVNLVGAAGMTGYSWSSGQTTQSITVTGQSGTFILTANDANGCTAQDTAMVVFHPWTDPVPVIFPSPSTVICPGSSVTLDVGIFYTTYNWNTGATVQAITVTSPGTYTVTVANAFGCEMVSAPVTVTMGTNPTPTVIFTAGHFATTQSYSTYQWFFNSNILPNANGATHIPAITGWYGVIVTDSNGCSGRSDSLFADLTGVAETTEELQGLTLYPNPTMGAVNLRSLSPIDWPITVEIWTMYGQKVKSYDMAHLMDVVAFDLSDLAAAPYLMKISTFRHNKVQQSVIRFVKE